MNWLVVDASVAVKWYLPEVNSDDALRWLGRHDGYLIPELFFAEFGNVLRKQVVHGGLSAGAATEILEATRAYPWRIHSNRRLLMPAFASAMEFGLSVYDGFYVSLADRLDCKLVTALACCPGRQGVNRPLPAESYRACSRPDRRCCRRAAA